MRTSPTSRLPVEFCAIDCTDPRPARSGVSCLLTAVCASTLFALAGAATADDWSQFRGPNASGVSTAKHSLPVEFSATKNVHWKANVGDGVGCPVVRNGRVYVTAMDGEQSVALLCFDVASGSQLWKRSFYISELPTIHRVNSYASTTPAVDDEHVYFYSATLGMMAFDAETGADVWRTPLPKPFFAFVWGAAMSPVLHENRLLFVQDDDLNPAFYAFDTATGKVLWKDDRSDMAVNYSHPVVVETEQGDEIVVAGTGKLVGYDPATGKRLWYARVLLRNIKTTPSADGDRVYISVSSGGIANQWLATADKNNDGKLTRDEIRASTEGNPVPESFFAKFDRGDENRDGFLEGKELDKAFLHPDNFAGARFDADDPSESWIMAVRGGGRGDVTDTHVLWREESRAPDHLCSPILVDDRFFIVKGGGISNCFAPETGEAIWEMKRVQNIGDYYASPVAGDGKIYLAAENGKVVVLQSGPELKVLGRNDLGDSIVGTPAIAEGLLFVRTRTQLFVLGEHQP